MKKVSDILSRKGASVIAIDGSTTVLDALKLMSDKNIGSVVITENGDYAGLLTERDYARKVIFGYEVRKSTNCVNWHSSAGHSQQIRKYLPP